MKIKENITLKNSINYSFSIVTGASTIVGIMGYTIRDINDKLKWWQCSLILIAIFIAITIILFCIFSMIKHRGYTTTINNSNVKIKVGNIFSENGVKVIPFNECFDTIVDDVVIAHNSLNGKFIDSHVEDINDLNDKIQAAKNNTSSLKPTEIDNKTIYPLGRIIAYKDYLLLAFTHFDEENKAYIKVGEYEQLLIRMWQEIRRTYAARPIVIPFLGTGISTIDGVQSKNYTELLKCILCTFRNSKFQPQEGLTIILTQEAIEKVDMNVIKEEF